MKRLHQNPLSLTPLRAGLVCVVLIILQGCASTEELYAQYDENACKIEIANTPQRLPERIVVKEVEYRDLLVWHPALYFDYKKSSLKDEQQSKLFENLAVLKQHKDLRVVVRGFTDEVGSANYNRALAERRVDFVVNTLRERGIDSSRMEKMPLGEELPFVMSDSETQSAVNRRVELLLMDSSGRPIAYRVNHLSEVGPTQSDSPSSKGEIAAADPEE